MAAAAKNTCTREYEVELQRARGAQCVVGVDEVGRGCLAGPVTVCACVVPLGVTVVGVNDSKKLSEKRRETVFQQLTTHPDVKYAVVSLPPEEIDRLNILRATMKAMAMAVDKLQSDHNLAIDVVLVDGNQAPPELTSKYSVQTVVGGDATCYPIAAASIIAKVTRDHMMVQYDSAFPGYGLAQHKGYGTAQHRAALKKLGPTPLHRRSFHLKN